MYVCINNCHFFVCMFVCVSLCIPPSPSHSPLSPLSIPPLSLPLPPRDRDGHRDWDNRGGYDPHGPPGQEFGRTGYQGIPPGKLLRSSYPYMDSYGYNAQTRAFLVCRGFALYCFSL